MKHVVLVGATDGIGRALAASYLRRGWRVGLVGRDPGKLERVAGELRVREPEGMVATVACDVRDAGRVPGAFQDVLRALGQMDLLVYCAGVMPPYGEDLDDRLAGIAPIFEVNVQGAIRFLELAADYFEAAGEGRLAAIGSMAGVRGRRGHPVYGASKAALHQYLEGLRHRLHRSGVGVTTVEPGWVRTRMLDAGKARSRAAVDAERAAEIIARGLDRGRDVLFVPRWWALVAAVLRLMPRPLFKRLAPP
ncbi:MAG TPA: SDR family NAD(P)-dependent oxidoreductase [Longimicrobiales bacterium]|jgi:short-subunit dehydrogenase|nr:SDR family NAD(P)-dependent oxidoreductase [Longimicrobiales bacterium]